MASAGIVAGVVEAALNVGARLGGDRFKKRHRSIVNLRIHELVLEAEFVSQSGELKLGWVYYQLMNDPKKKIRKSARKLMWDPDEIPNMIGQAVTRLKELDLLGERLGGLDLSGLID